MVVIVVATADFQLYHTVLEELRDRGVTFTTIEPDATVNNGLPDRTSVVIATPEDRVSLGDRDDIAFVAADPEDPRAAVDEALAALRGGGGRTVVGVDPGPSPGIAVLVGDTVVAAFRVPLSEAVETIGSETTGEPDALVRVGDGDRLKGARIVNDLPEDLAVELVDESGTTPYLGAGVRGMGDVLAAVNIARIEGEPTARREIEPTAGELQRIKDESRKRSAGDRTIDEVLARRVAAGELTLEEAIDEHRSDDSS
ncbi:hypothetical protein SAMN05192561_103116 [Halopenitus malekzadehii]|uniref:Uncharacterized protein n=1 Tax=Halopenitus malekzadehii TaxID=1267564 RepID=A0A1H6IP34_9EURY|nr:hypothetical protein SAMN05192561_103116 [Halopenitus malekzadehii]